MLYICTVKFDVKKILNFFGFSSELNKTSIQEAGQNGEKPKRGDYIH